MSKTRAHQAQRIRSGGTRKRSFELSQRTRITLIVLAASVVVVGGGWWAFYTFTTMPPPKLETAAPQDVAKFLGSSRGFARMSVNRREAFLAQACEQFTTREERVRFNDSLRALSSSERKVFLDAFFEVGKNYFIEQAREYHNLSPQQRADFVDNTIRSLEGMRAGLVGQTAGGGPAADLRDPFKDDVPAGGEALTKMLWTATSPRERELGRKLADDIASRYKTLQDPRERQRFDQAGG